MRGGRLALSGALWLLSSACAASLEPEGHLCERWERDTLVAAASASRDLVLATARAGTVTLAANWVASLHKLGVHHYVLVCLDRTCAQAAAANGWQHIDVSERYGKLAQELEECRSKHGSHAAAVSTACERAEREIAQARWEILTCAVELKLTTTINDVATVWLRHGGPVESGTTDEGLGADVRGVADADIIAMREERRPFEFDAERRTSCGAAHVSIAMLTVAAGRKAALDLLHYVLDKLSSDTPPPKKTDKYTALCPDQAYLNLRLRELGITWDRPVHEQLRLTGTRPEYAHVDWVGGNEDGRNLTFGVLPMSLWMDMRYYSENPRYSEFHKMLMREVHERRPGVWDLCAEAVDPALRRSPPEHAAASRTYIDSCHEAECYDKFIRCAQNLVIRRSDVKNLMGRDWDGRGPVAALCHGADPSEKVKCLSESGAWVLEGDTLFNETAARMSQAVEVISVETAVRNIWITVFMCAVAVSSLAFAPKLYNAIYGNVPEPPSASRNMSPRFRYTELVDMEASRSTSSPAGSPRRQAN